jgi:hypothetical protein
MRLINFLLLILLAGCHKKPGTLPPDPDNPTPKCDTASATTRTFVSPFYLGRSVYTEISTPFKKQYRFTTDTTATYKYLVNSNPEVYDSVDLKMQYQMISSFYFFNNDTAHQSSFYVVCSAAKPGGSLFDTLFIVTSNPIREVLTLKKTY